jgi:hypothetical protein
MQLLPLHLDSTTTQSALVHPQDDPWTTLYRHCAGVSRSTGKTDDSLIASFLPIPFVGAYIESHIAPNLHAAHVLEVWVEMGNMMQKSESSGDKFRNSDLGAMLEMGHGAEYDSQFRSQFVSIAHL